jgi:superfamily II DNA or RNA helicase
MSAVHQLTLDGHAARAHPTTPALPLRPYQEEALERVDLRELAGVTRQLVVLPTGGGKTVVAAHLIARRQRHAVTTGQGSGRTLFLAHRDELIQQAAGKLHQVAPALEIGIVKAERDEVGADVVVASVQTLARPSRLARLEPDFDLVVVDEAHHATSATWVGVLSGLGGMRDDGRGPLVVGITATPERSDRVGLGQVWQEIVYSRSILEMITDGYLVDARGLMVSTPADLARLRTSHGDLVDAEIGAELVRSGALGSIAEAYATHARDRKGVAFVPTVETAYSLADALRAEGVPAEGIDGTTPREQRRAILHRLRTGETQVVCNAQLLCLDAETEILTDQGWAGIDEMTEGHQVANWDDGRIFFERPREIVHRPRAPGEDMVYLETPRRSIRVTGGHRMLYRVAKNDVWGKVAARDLVGWSAELPICGDAEPFDVGPEQPETLSEAWRKRLISSRAYHIRTREGVQWEASFEEAARRVDRKHALRRKAPSELSLDECALIGFWIGDGSANHPRRNGIEYLLSQSTAYPEIIRWVDEKFDAVGIHSVRHLVPGRPGVKPSVRWSFGRGTGGGSQERSGAFGIEPYLNKDGSALLWGLDDKQFEALIIGLWYADGIHGQAEQPPSASLVITGSNHRLLSLLQAIAVCRGWTASILGPCAIAKATHAPMYQLAMRRHRTHRMSGQKAEFMLRQEDGWREERVWCVRTTSHNIVTRRRGTVTVMGNTEGWDEPSISCVLIARPTRSRPAYIQMAGRGLRIYPGKTDCLILDVAGATARLDLMTVADLAGLSKKEIEGRTIAEAVAAKQAQEAKERQTAEALKVATATAATSLIRSTLRWVQAGSSFVLSVDGGMIRLEPEGAGETWRVRRDLRSDQRVIAEGLSLEYAQGFGEDQVRQLGASTLAQADAPWRERPPTDKQRAFLERKRVSIPDGATRGWAADQITALIATSPSTPRRGAGRRRT